MKYEKKDGTAQEWLMSGGDDLLKKYSELDPRFAQTIAYQGAVYGMMKSGNLIFWREARIRSLTTRPVTSSASGCREHSRLHIRTTVLIWTGLFSAWQNFI